jgi:hypothetical protein
MNKWASIWCLCVCLLLSGCAPDAGASPNVVGKWKDAAPSTGAQQNGAAGQMSLANGMSIDLRADKTFAMSMFIAYEGTWDQSGSTITLTVDKTAGTKSNPMSKPRIMFTVSADGQTLLSEDKTGTGRGVMKFVRAQ